MKLRVFHFCSAKNGLSNIELRRVKVSTFDSVNDPFELLCHNLGDAEYRRRMGRFKDSLVKGQGMICFSKSRKSPVQWAHYADRHRGVCLGFDVPDEYVADVIYTEKRLELRAERLFEEGNHSLTEEVLMTKYKHWEYEEEVRAFGDLGVPDKETGLYFQPFSENLVLKEVAVGFNSEISRSDLSQKLGDLSSGVSCYKVRPSFQSFEMVINQNDALWK